VNSRPLAAAARMMDVEDMAIAAALFATRKVCSTLTGASGWEAGRRLAFHVDRAGVTVQMQENLTEVYGKRLGEIPFCSWLRPP
jgi:hypothetical protein